MSYSKNVVIASGTSTGGFEQGIVTSNVFSGTLVAMQADGTFAPSNKGELFVVLEAMNSSALEGHNAGDVVRVAPLIKPFVFNFILAAGLDVKQGYALYADEHGHVTNVETAGAAVIAYAREDAVSTDKPVQIAGAAQ